MLGRIDVAVDHELVANRRARAVKQLAADIPAGAAVMAAAILPGDNKAGIRALESRHRRLLLGTRRVVVDPEVAAQSLRRHQRAFTVNRGKDLAADVITGT